MYTEITAGVDSNHEPNSLFAFNKHLILKNQPLEEEINLMTMIVMTMIWVFVWKDLLTGEDDIWNSFSTADLPSIPWEEFFIRL